MHVSEIANRRDLAEMLADAPLKYSPRYKTNDSTLEMINYGRSEYGALTVRTWRSTRFTARPLDPT